MKGDIGKSDQKQKDKYRDNYDDIFRKEEVEGTVGTVDTSMWGEGEKLYVSQDKPGGLTNKKFVEESGVISQEVYADIDKWVREMSNKLSEDFNRMAQEGYDVK